uniref:DUF4281 domain-containing protein n=1 Tax=Rhodosorus marinus TaxID=101924 RepID=A0A7S0G8A9_9RHOD|mmetsp:Transcript_6023/g.8526  ORF Transcript_6023/g.8526 Transcript_6023/m.8526 type:complete len:167 (+) Transcript_6023:280-780(+)
MKHLVITMNLFLRICFGTTLFTWILFTYSPTSGYSRVAVGSAVLPFLFSLGIPLAIWKVDIRNLNISSLESLRTYLFSSDDVLLVFVLQYLAFGLLVGSWMALDGARLGIPSYLMVPCLAMTMYLGPFGVFIYACVRYYLRGKVLLFDTLFEEAERAEIRRKDRDV